MALALHQIKTGLFSGARSRTGVSSFCRGMGFHLQLLHIHLSVIIKCEVDPDKSGVRNSKFSWNLVYISENGWDRSMSFDSLE